MRAELIIFETAVQTTVYEKVPLQLLFTFLSSIPMAIYLGVSQKDSGARLGLIGLWAVSVGKSVKRLLLKKG